MTKAGSPRRSRIYRLLECERIYRMAQTLLAPRGRTDVAARMRSLIESLPKAEPLLDVGCGPSSWLWAVGRRPVGADLSPAYLRPWARLGEHAVVASADRLPFHSHTFGGVWSIGLLHHLDDDRARRTIREMLRVCRVGGYVAILDAVTPRSAWRRPVASFLRRIDRGGFVRGEEDFCRLIPATVAFRLERLSYSIHKLEMLVCTHIVGGATP